MAGHTGIYLKILIAVCLLTALSQLSFQIVLLALSPYGNFLENCEFLEKVLRHVGLVRLDKIRAMAIFTWLFPEVVMMVTSIGAHVLLSKLTRSRTVEVSEEASNLPKKAKSTRKQWGIAVALGKYLVLFALCFAAVLRPSVPGGFYFLVFLCTATWWSCYKQLRKGFAVLMRCIMVVVVAHMGCLYGYQFQWTQELLDQNATYARYFGLTPLLTVRIIDFLASFFSDSLQ